MLMNTRHQTKANGSPDSLCQFPLVDGSQAGLASVFYAAHGRHVFGHDGEVLCSESSGQPPCTAWEKMPAVDSIRRTLYNSRGLIFRASKESVGGL